MLKWPYGIDKIKCKQNGTHTVNYLNGITYVSMVSDNTIKTQNTLKIIGYYLLYFKWNFLLTAKMVKEKTQKYNKNNIDLSFVFLFEWMSTQR